MSEPTHARRARWRLRQVVRPPLAVLAAIVALLFMGVASVHAAPTTESVWGDAAPTSAVASDSSAVTVGTRFRVTADGAISAIRLYKGAGDAMSFTGTLWDASGRVLASVDFPRTRATGWLEAPLSQSVRVAAGGQYVVGYRSSVGKYSYAYNALGDGLTKSSASLVALAGVYNYGQGLPAATYRKSAYFADVRYMRGSATPAPPSTATPSPSVPGTPKPSSPTPVPTQASSSAPSSTGLSLPRVAWEGGPDYWKRFPNAAKWADPSFFPIGIWFNGVSTDAEAKWDKDHGINSYAGMSSDTNFSLFEKNNIFWVGGKLNSTFKESSLNWPGVFMDDEVDGRYAPAAGVKFLQDIKNSYAGSGKFMYANYTQLVIGSDMAKADQEKYVNLTDAVSLDMYWYSIPFCDWTPYRGDLYADPVPKSTCRTSSSYGKAVNGLTIRDAADGKLQPRWMFLENLNGLSGQTHRGYITPGQLKGAAMNSVINEARGLWWFNQSITGDCRAGSALRAAQVQGAKFCGYAQMEAMGEVNNLIHSLARVINTQSYEWNFGTGLDTMLKTYDGYAYIFAMTDGTTGNRTLTLPAGINGTSAEVVGENRTLTVSNKKLADNFTNEYTYHIYKIKL